MAAKYRRIDPRIWDDERFDDLEAADALAAFWLITGRPVNRCGIAVFSLGESADKIRVDTAAAAWETLSKVCAALNWPLEKASRTTCVAVLPSWFKYQPPANRDHLRGNMADLADVPRCEVVTAARDKIRAHIPPALMEHFDSFWREFYGHADTVADTVSDTVPALWPTSEAEAEAETVTEAEAIKKKQKRKTTRRDESKTKAVDAVLSHYRELHPLARPGKKERSLIAARWAEGYSAKDLKDAIDGCHATPFNAGDNDRNAKHLGIAVIFRSSDQVARFIETTRHPPQQRNGRKSRRQTFDPRQTTIENETFGKM